MKKSVTSPLPLVLVHFVIFLFSFSLVHGSSFKISAALATAVCEQKNVFGKRGHLQQPIRTRPKHQPQKDDQKMECGWHSFSGCGPPGRTLNVTKCGYLGFEECGRIVGGFEVSPKYKYPSIVAIWVHRTSETSFCGGTILSPNWILTAAHCTNEMSYLTATAGEHTINQEEGPEQKVQSIFAIQHPQYDPKADGLPNDISLVQVSPWFVFNEWVRPVILPRDPTYVPEDMSIVVGWGYTIAGATVISNILREVKMPIITDKECRIYKNKKILDSHICVYNPGHGPCQGDSGGPMFHIVGNEQIQVGIVSWGSALCGDKYEPGVMTEVSYYLEWILANAVS